MINNAVGNILNMVQYGDAGLNWYQEAHVFAQNLAALYDTSVEVVSGMIAALSPQNKWPTNQEDAIHLLEAYQTGQDVYSVKVSTFNPNKGKAIFIMLGYGLPLEILGGNKTRSFYRNILNPNDCEYVTVDRHAVSIALGERVTDMNKISYYIRTDKRYQTMVEYYKHAANELSLLPCQVQAITWVNYRNLYEVN